MIKDVDIRAKVDKKTKAKYKSFCKKYNYVLSKRLRALIDMDMKGKIKG